MRISIGYATAINLLVLLLVIITLWNIPPAQTLGPDDRLALEQIRSDIESLRLTLQENRQNESDLFASTSINNKDSEIAIPIIVQLREMIRDELGALRDAHTVKTDIQSSQLITKKSRNIDPDKQEQAEQSATAIVEKIIADQAIGDGDYQQLMEWAPYLSDEVKMELTDKVIMAINRQELQLQEPFLLPF